VNRRRRWDTPAGSAAARHHPPAALSQNCGVTQSARAMTAARRRLWSQQLSSVICVSTRQYSGECRTGRTVRTVYQCNATDAAAFCSRLCCTAASSGHQLEPEEPPSDSESLSATAAAGSRSARAYCTVCAIRRKARRRRRRRGGSWVPPPTVSPRRAPQLQDSEPILW
jgi:hypothetical protein